MVTQDLVDGQSQCGVVEELLAFVGVEGVGAGVGDAAVEAVGGAPDVVVWPELSDLVGQVGLGAVFSSAQGCGIVVAGLAVVFWAFATWLIPPLVAAGWWRHVVRKIPLRYDATLWSMIFPLGMYAAAGIYLGRADDLPLVHRIASIELWVAFAAAVTVFVAMVVHVDRTVRRRPPGGATTSSG